MMRNAGKGRLGVQDGGEGGDEGGWMHTKFGVTNLG